MDEAMGVRTAPELTQTLVVSKRAVLAAQYIGAALVLFAYMASAREWLDPTTRTSLGVNLVGAALLVWSALHGRQWGFLVLNVVWCVVAFSGLVATL